MMKIFQITTKTSTRRKPSWKKLSTLSFKNFTNNMVELKEEMMKTGMMKIFQITTNCKIFGNDLRKRKAPSEKRVLLLEDGLPLRAGFLYSLHLFKRTYTHTLTLLPIATKNLIFTPHTSVVLFGIIFSISG